MFFKITHMNVETVNYWYFVFAVTPKHDPDVFQMCFRCVSELLRESG